MTRKLVWITVGTVALFIPLVLVAPNGHTSARVANHDKAGRTTLSRADIGRKLPATARFQQRPEGVTQKKSAQIASIGDEIYTDGMSPMGRIAYLVNKARAQFPNGGKGGTIHINSGGDVCQGADEDCGDQDGPAGGQAEMAIAVDATGLHVVVGFNDTRGFALNPVSVSGFAYSDDGGANFTDGGQLPSPTVSSIGVTNYPQVFGDPDIKYVPGGAGGQFIYTSIEVKTISATGAAQTMCVHRSTDFGHTWTGPFEIIPATNPTGVLSGVNARDAADKEFIDIDPDTGRVLMSWSNFTAASVIPGQVQISTTFSDNIMTATPPTWSVRQVLNAGATDFDTGSMPRFVGRGSLNAYVAWSRTSNTQATPYGGFGFNNIGFSKSTDNGATWSVAPLNLRAAYYFPPDYILGNDRTHSFPSMAVDNSAGANSGNIYIVYGDNNNKDGEDIAFQRSTNGGTSFSAVPTFLDPRPGTDRPQWFPYVTVDPTSGRVWVTYYDESVGSSGEWMQTTATYSDDGGVTWVRPFLLSDRPFHGGYGNDTGQPNLGDYIASTVQGGNLNATWAGNPPVVLFTDAVATGQFSTPDFYFKKTNTSQAAIDIPDGVTTFVQNGAAGGLTIPLRNTTTNPALSPATYTGVSATLSTTTANVTISGATRAYANIAAGATQSNASQFGLTMNAGFVQGTKIDLSLSVTTAQGNVTLPFQVNTGKGTVTNLITQNFDATAVGALPAGWSNIHSGGTTTVPWAVGNHLPKTNAVVSNGAFHANANDAPNPNRDERLSTPVVAIPAGSQYVTVDFDIAYDTEDDPDFNVLAYDGSLLRITDNATGFIIIAEAFAEQITTATNATTGIFHYPKHFPRNNSAGYLQDMSAWSGDSGGFKHVSMRLPGMAGRSVLFRWDFVQDGGGICTDVRAADANCGVLIDNIVINSVAFAAPTSASSSISGSIASGDGSALAGVTMRLSGAKTAETITDSSGAYQFDGVDSGGFYTVTPVLANYHFSPASRSFSLIGNMTDAVFTGTPDATVVGNPSDTTEYFVRQQYLDFLGREPDQGGFDYWVGQINQCGSDADCTRQRRIDVSAAFFASEEFQQTGSYIYGLYAGALGRTPGFGEFMPDRAQVIGGAGLAQARVNFANAFVQRAEFTAKYPQTMTRDQFVDALIQTMTTRTGVDQTSLRATMLSDYDTGGRSLVVRDAASANTFTQPEYNKSFVLMEYFGYLRRGPDQGGYDFWLNVLNTREPGNYRGMVCAFITSAEYQKRFGPVITHTNSECGQ